MQVLLLSFLKGTSSHYDRLFAHVGPMILEKTFLAYELAGRVIYDLCVLDANFITFLLGLRQLVCLELLASFFEQLIELVILRYLGLVLLFLGLHWCISLSFSLFLVV